MALEDPYKQNVKYGFCKRVGRWHMLADKRGNKPGWCIHCKNDWEEKK